MKRWTILLLAVFLVTTLIGATGCGAKAADARNLKIAVLDDAKNLNPYMGYGSTETFITGLVYDTLLGYDDEKGECTPGLADKWSYKDGGTTIAFELNPKATFSDGKAVTADDVVFTFKMIKEAKFPGFMAITGNLSEAVKTGTNSVELKLRAPLAGSLRLLGTAVSIVPKHIWETVKDPVNNPNLQPVGSGPFALAKKADGQYIVLEARKHYRHKYNIRQITLTVVRDQTVGLMSLKAGQFDLLNWSIDPAVAADIQAKPNDYPGVKVAAAPSSRVTTLMFNLRRKPFDDVNFRKAVSLVIDQEKLIKDVLLGFGRPQGPGLVAPAQPHYNDKYPPVQADAAAAAALLDQFGYKDVNKDGWRETPTRQKLAMELISINVPPQMNVAEYIVSELKKVGINATLTPLTAEALRNRQMAADFDASMFNISFSNTDMMYFYYTTSRGIVKDGRVSGFNYGGFTDPAFDGVAMAMRAELDRAKYIELCKQMQVFIAESYYHVPVYASDVIQVYRDDRFTGWANEPETAVSNSTTFLGLTPKK